MGEKGPLRVYKKELEKALRLAEKGRDYAEFPEIRAESYYIMGESQLLNSVVVVRGAALGPRV